MLRAVACVLLILVGACKGDRRPATTAHTGVGSGSGSSVAPAPPAQLDDPHSQARPELVSVRHLTLELDVDFEAKQLSGTAALQLVRHDRAATEVVLDSDGLIIDSVVDCAAKQPLEHALGPAAKIGGQALTVQLAGDCVRIAYRTAPTAKALLWVDPSGTAGKQHPMLFTQSQAILARTWIPLQDSPGVRFTYDATIRVPEGLWAVMSATNPQTPPADGVWKFSQERAIPSYLMALAVGDLAFKAIGARTGVYAEPAMVEAAAYEFAEVDAMMAAAEKLYGPYRWGRYDMLVLPPSFPFGGMENPRLTFLTPTVISGDRSLVSLIAHELAHSWSGNLVTNSTWNDVWLNEGFTTYVERRIMEELRGKVVADIGWALGRKDLEEVLDDVGRTNPDTRLALDFTADRSPEDAPGDIAYEKGSLLLRAMELAFGRERFDAFLRERFDRLAFQSTDSRAFEADAAALFAEKDPGWKLADWLHGPGLPATAPPSTSTRVDALEQAAATFAKAGTLPDAAAWSSLEWTAFLRALPDETPRARLEALDRKYKLTASPNAVIGMRWLPILIRADIRRAAPTIEAYVIRVGRRWLVRTVYEAMIGKNEFWRALAARSFAKAKPGYHAVTRDTIAEMLAKPGQDH